MKTVSILIANWNSYQAIELCIESIRHYTTYPNYNIIVYDDCSDNEADLRYLREKQKQGWLELIEGKERLRHGGSLNILINESCKADLAMIMDCDIQILSKGWLANMVELVSQDEKIIAATNCFGIQRRGKSCLLAPFAAFWFGMVNMKAYRDGMQVDWQNVRIKDKAKIQEILGNDPGFNFDEFNELAVDVGCKLLLKVRQSNPKGYYFIKELPEYIESSYHHYRQISCFSKVEREDIKEIMDTQFAKIKRELEKLRR